MRIDTLLPDRRQTPVRLVMPARNNRQLLDTRFLGRRNCFASCIFRWHSPLQLLSDPLLQAKLLGDIVDSTDEFSELGLNCWSVSMDHTEPIGWESSDLADNYQERDSYYYPLNQQAIIRRLHSDLPDVIAPLTTRVTIVYSLRWDDEQGWITFVHDLQPGVDLGNPVGDLTKRERRVLYAHRQRGVAL